MRRVPRIAIVGGGVGGLATALGLERRGVEMWTRECDVSELTTTYAGWHPDLLRLYPYSARWYKWALYDRNPVERWSKGRVRGQGKAQLATSRF
jgi:salicylate hydroxylase